MHETFSCDGKEKKHVERRCWTQQWVSEREEHGAYYTIFKELAAENSSRFESNE